MKSPISKTGLFFAAAILALAGQSTYALAFQDAPAAEAQDPDAVILDRQLIMQQVDKDTKALGMILAGIQPKTDLVKVSQSIAKSAKEAQESFKPKVPGGGSKPEIWSNWDDFSKRMDVFVAKSEEMTKVAETGDLFRIGELVVDIQCKQCHDLYRLKK